MARKKKNQDQDQQPKSSVNGVISGAGEVVEQDINDTLKLNYMPYAMSVITSRAIPDIDGFKPSHRKLLYMMYKMGLLGPSRTKSANIVGSTMKLNPHGDSAIYDTMARLSRGYEALLHPYVDSKGNFGKAYSRDMACAASRYTEAKLDAICKELFKDIDKDTVDFVDNYDSTMKEPTLLPATFPTILVNANTGIAVGMASSICSFNLAEICETTIEYIRDPDHDILSTLKAPDFPGGGEILFDAEEMKNIYKTGRGGIKVRSVYSYDKDANCIDVTEIPPTTTAEEIVEKVVDLVKKGKIREISDIRDETGIQGLRVTMDLKRGVDPDKLMQKLFRMTPLEDSFPCNFNILIAGVPHVLGVEEILGEWVAFRTECIKRRTYYDMTKEKDKLHLLEALEKILLDIDKAIQVIRGTEVETEVVPNLMIAFGIDQTQAEYIAEIKLRHLNREYLLDRTKEKNDLEKHIAELESIIHSPLKIKNIIIEELSEVAENYGQERKSKIVAAKEAVVEIEEEETPDYAVNLFFSKAGYFKKITPLSLRMSGDQKLKEDDVITEAIESVNSADLLFFTDKSQVYKCRASDFADTKASVLGEYIPAKLQMDDGENAIYMAVTTDYSGFIMFFFENGKSAKVPVSSYETKTNRKKLINAYSDKCPVATILQIREDCDVVLTDSTGRVLLFGTGLIAPKTSKNTQGVATMKLRKNQRLVNAVVYVEGRFSDPAKYRKNIPGAGTVLKSDDVGEQMSF
jgi:DNA gyrase subunit A